MKLYLFLISILLLLFSCSQEKKQSREELFTMLDTLKVDLFKLPVEVEGIDVGDKIIARYKEDRVSIMNDIDSLLEKYPTSYSLKAMKVAILSNQSLDSLKKFTDKLYEKNPKDIQARYFYHLTYADSNSFNSYIDLINDHPDHFLGYFGLAQTIMYTQKGMDRFVLKLAYLAAMQNPTTDDPFLLLEHLYNQRKLEDQKAYLNGVMLRRDPSNKGYFRNLYFYYLTQDDKEKASYLIETFHKNNPEKMDIMELAYLYATTENKAKAVEFLNKGEKDETNPKYLSIYASIMALNGEKEKAVEGLVKFRDKTKISNIDFFLDVAYAENLYQYKPYLKLLSTLSGDKITIGSTIPKDLKGMDISGKEIKFEDYLGSVTMIPFWGAFDPKSSDLIKNYSQLIKGFEGKDFKILGIELENNPQEGVTFHQNNPLDFDNILVNGAFQAPFTQQFAVTTLPSTLIVDKKGVVRYFNLQGFQIKSKIEKLLNE